MQKVMVSDEQLLQQIAAGDHASLEALIFRYHKPIYAYLVRMLDDQALAEDLTQECFIRLCRAVKQAQLPTQFRPWLYRVASNLCKDIWKSAAYRNETLADHQYLSIYRDQESVLSILDRQWEREAVIAALEQLKPEEKQLLILRFYQELKIQEISDIVQLPLSTVKSRLYQSFKKLAKTLRQKEGANHEPNTKSSS